MSFARIRCVFREFDNFAIAVKGGYEELKETSKSEQRTVYWRRRKRNAHRPLAVFFTVTDSQNDLRIA